MDDAQRNAEVEKIANAMVHDGLPDDEQDRAKLAKYRDQVKSDCGVGDEEAMGIVYETLLYRKMKNSGSGDFLERGNEFGAGFS